MTNAYRDENGVPTLIAVSSTDGFTPIRIYADPNTHRLLVDSTSGVVGPVSSTDNAVARFDGTTGQTVQNSVVIIGDTGAITGVLSIVASGAGDFASYKVGGVAGGSGSFTTVDLKTVTVVNGIITTIV